MKKIFILLLTSFAICSIWSQTYTVETIPNPKKLNRFAFVSNPDGILNPETESQINNLLDSLEKKTGAEVAIVLVNSIGNEDIKSFAEQLFNSWKIGKEKEDNGLLVLFVMDQRKVTFEVGYGLEGILPDAICKRIQIESMIPEFKKGNYDAGILAGVQRIYATILKEPVQVEKTAPVNWKEILPLALGFYLIWLVLTWLWMGNAMNKVKMNPRLKSNMARYIAAKNERNGIVSVMAIFLPIAAFIAILVLSQAIYLLLLLPLPFMTIPPLIYANYRLQKIRKEPFPCSVCGGQMHFVPEKEEDVYLKLSQQFEEQLHAVDYDVFVCDNCKNEAIFTIDRPSAYSECPKCGTKAFILKDKKLTMAPTYFNAGTERLTYRCEFCGYEENKNRRIPRLTRANSTFIGGAAAGSIFSGSGGFGGGSFGGGMSG
ncbi:MAG TPA: TPM domain-containing protein, partial [Paludibacteraceae bacterium]|nr:TPM domain-containing protein [Paludibacteraceae bacterium]